MEEYIYDHISILVEDDVYIWGGYRPEKGQLFSSIDTFNVLNSKLAKRPTTGTPPNGAINYSSCCVGNDIYYFGGRSDRVCFHDDLSVFSTASNEWRQITACNNNGPIKKFGCGMIPFSINGEDYILVIGGRGTLPSNPPSHAQYTCHPDNQSRCLTNEVHIMCVSTTPGEWTVPTRTGSVFPPLSRFSINTLPGNRAIVFGGKSINKQNDTRFILYSNDVFIISYTNNTVDFQRLNHSATNVPWPEGRYGHSSVVISSVSGNGKEKHYLLVLGGWGVGWSTKADCWILELTKYQWKQISLPEAVTKRWCHSMSCYNMSDHCKWVIVSGGDRVYSPNKLMIVELVFSPTDDNWTVTNVLNEEDIEETTNYTKLVSDRLSVSRRCRLEIDTNKASTIEQQSVIGIDSDTKPVPVNPPIETDKHGEPSDVAQDNPAGMTEPGGTKYNGKDSTEAFESISHCPAAPETRKSYLMETLVEGLPPKATPTTTSTITRSSCWRICRGRRGMSTLTVVGMGVAVVAVAAFAFYKYKTR